MELPDETLLDSLRFLDRASLDAVQFSSKHFRKAVEKLSDVCLRRLEHAYIGVGYEGTDLLPHSYTMQATLQGNELTKHMIATEENAGEFFASLIASSFIERVGIERVRLTDRLLLPLQPVLATVNVNSLFISGVDFASVSPNVFVETLTAFGSIHVVLRIAFANNIRPGHINDALVNYAAEKGTREVHLAVGYKFGNDVTDESILNFLKARRRGHEIRRLAICRPRLSPHFLERLVETHQSGLVVSDIDMSLFELNFPRPEANDPLRSLSVENADGNVLSFGEEIKLVTKFGRQSIEYNRRAARV